MGRFSYGIFYVNLACLKIGKIVSETLLFMYYNVAYRT